MQFHGMSGLASVLVQAQLITPVKLQQVGRVAARMGVPLVTQLLDQGLISENELFALVSRYSSVPIFSPAHETDVEAVRLVPHSQAMRCRLLPIRLLPELEPPALVLAMVDPFDQQVIEEIEFSTNYRVLPILARATQIADGIRTHYSHVITRVIKRKPTQKLDFGDAMDSEQIDTQPAVKLQRQATTAHRVHALVSLMIRKGLITQDEYEDQLVWIIEAPPEGDTPENQ